jgi:hypothetical protein
VDRLAPLVGEWTMEASLAPPGAVAATTTFAWGLGGRVLLQTARIEVPEAPDLLAVIAADPATGALTQHYFDSRGVVRLYAMTFEEGVWTLLREAPDFSPLEFAQRFTGTLSADGRTIEGRWESRAPDAADWQPDFDLTYRRADA